MKKLTSLLILILIFVFSSNSQSIKRDYSLSCDSALSLYNKHMHSEDDCIIGQEYKMYHSYKQDNPYLNSHHGLGTIYSKGYIYDKKIILYDMYKDEVVINRIFKNSSNINVNIQKAQIDSFLIEFEEKKHLIKHIKNNNSCKNQIQCGFYENPYTGKFQLLLKHKAKKRDVSGITTYSHNISIFLKIGDGYFNINSKKKLFELFYTNKKQLKKKYHLLNTPYKRLTTSQLIDFIKYIETL